MSPRFTVRAATRADATAIGTIHAAAWRATYRGVMSDDFLDGIDQARVIASWERMLAGGDTHEGHWADLVVADNERVVGWCGVGAARDDLAEGKWASARLAQHARFPDAQLWALNLAPAAWGTGAAAVLHDAALAVLAEHAKDAYLWVAEGNPRARRFYEREGWRADGLTQREELGGALVAELRYLRSL